MNRHIRGPLVPGPDCASFAHLLPLLGTGTLNAAEEQAVRRHAAGCAWCRAQLADYAKTDAALRQHVGSLMMEAPRQRMEDILRLAEAPTRSKKRPPMRAASRRPRRLLPGLGALAAVLLLALLFEIVFSHTAVNRLKPTATPLPTPTVNLNGVTLYAGIPILSAIRATNGSILWHTNAFVSDVQPSAVSHDVIYSVHTQTDGNGTTTVRLLKIGAKTGEAELDRAVDLPPLDAPSPHFTVAGDTLYVTSDTVGVGSLSGSQHGVYALQASDGVVLWRHPTTEPAITAPLVVNGVVYAGVGTSLVALRASDGTLLWQVPLLANGKPALSQTLASDARAIYVVAGEQVPENPNSDTGTNNVLYALRPSDGGVLWRFDLGGGYLQDAPPVVAQGMGIVYVSAGASPDELAQGNQTSAHLYALRASDGKQLWQYREDAVHLTLPSGEKQTYGANFNGLSAADGFVYAYDLTNNVMAFQGNNGALLWKKTYSGEHIPPLGGLGGIAVAGGAVFVDVNGMVHQGINGADAIPDPNQLVALRAGDGSTLWTRTYPNWVGVIGSPPVVAP